MNFLKSAWDFYSLLSAILVTYAIGVSLYKQYKTNKEKEDKQNFFKNK